MRRDRSRRSAALRLIAREVAPRCARGRAIVAAAAPARIDHHLLQPRARRRHRHVAHEPVFIRLPIHDERDRCHADEAHGHAILPAAIGKENRVSPVVAGLRVPRDLPVDRRRIDRRAGERLRVRPGDDAGEDVGRAPDLRAGSGGTASAVRREASECERARRFIRTAERSRACHLIRIAACGRSRHKGSKHMQRALRVVEDGAHLARRLCSDSLAGDNRCST